MSQSPELPALPDIAALLDGFIDPVVLIGVDYRILAANRLYHQHYGAFEVAAQPRCYEVSHRYQQPCDLAGETCPLKNSLETGQPQQVLHLHYTSHGEEHVNVETLPIRNADGEITYFLEILHKAGVTGRQGGEAQTLAGRSLAFTRMLGLVERVAPSDATVLLLGESGTGKEVLAKAVHDASRRAGGPFVPVDCSGLTESLFESELFGHEKGAFTGAHSRKIGLVEAAHGGTLFLDEVGDIPLPLQVKLLRLLETSSFRRVGSVEPQQAEFRLVCATHRDLQAMVADGSFRQDLYYRISAFPIDIPPLRERVEDMELLAKALLDRVSSDRPLTLHADALKCLKHYAFPGNIRELRNMLERASLLADGDVILPEHLPQECQCAVRASQPLPVAFKGEVQPLKVVEQQYLQWAVAQHRADKRTLADQLGLSERTFYRKLQELEKGEEKK